MDPGLYRAATTGNVGYLENGDDDYVVHQRTPKDSNVLHIAAEFKQIEFFRHLSDHARYRPLFWGTNKKADTPLHVAARVGCEEVVKFLIEHAKKVQHIIEESGVPTDKQLLRLTNWQKDTALHLAARYDCRGVVTLLMEADPELCSFTNNANESPLFIATRKGNVQTALSILNDCPIPPSYDGTNKLTALHAAVIRIRIRGIREIILRCSSIPDIDYSLVKLMVSKNPGIIKAVDAVGWTPLHYAALGGNPEATQILMKGDSSASYILDNFGMSALHVAAFAGRTKVMKEMIRDRPDTCDLHNHKGQTILHAAVFGGQDNVVKYILKTPELAGLINDADHDGNTPLHLAAIHKRHIIMTILVSNARVDKTATNNKLEKAVDIVIGDRLEQDKLDNLLPRVCQRMGGYTGVPYFHEQIQCEFMKLESLKNDTSNTQEMKASSSNKGSKKFDTNLLIAILIATVTFTAAFTIPGGFKSDGTPVLQDKIAFQVFLIFDALSFLISISSVFLNFTTATFLGSHRYAHPNLIKFSIGGMIVAFASSIFVVLPNHSLLGIAIYVISGIFCLLVIFGFNFVLGKRARKMLWLKTRRF